QQEGQPDCDPSSSLTSRSSEPQQPQSLLDTW
uniref:Uncharacterized protein n=1 Tax=Amphimedon queenslandica TaxID=400682 RepID=A0A1X7VLF2_AMPQE